MGHFGGGGGVKPNWEFFPNSFISFMMAPLSQSVLMLVLHWGWGRRGQIFLHGRQILCVGYGGGDFIITKPKTADTEKGADTQIMSTDIFKNCVGTPPRPLYPKWPMGRSRQLSLNKFFDPSTPSMRNIESPAKSKMAARGPKNGRRGLERGLILGFWALPSTFAT